MEEEPISAAETEQHKRHLTRGFNWLGSGIIIARITDFVTIIAVLTFLTKTQVGIGSLVLSIGMMVEAFDGLGTGDALIQAKSLNERQLQSLFWFIMALAFVVGVLAVLLSPAVGWIYGMEGIPVYFLALAVKQPLVGGAVIPIAMLNRELRYEKIAIINVISTFGAAMTRLVIAMAGGGSWALVGGYVSSGAFILAGALWASPFKPGWYFNFGSIRPLLSFGLRSASANISDQIFKNIDYLLVGWFYGAASLAVYRVAFDLAMEPAMAVGSLVNRTALPVFARVAAVPAHLREALLWSLQRLTTLTAPCMAGLVLLAVPLTGLLHDSQGHSYKAAALPLQILAVAAMLRVATQLVTPVLMSSGRPGTAAKLSFTTLLLLSGLILLAGLTVHGNAGLVAVSLAWLAVYPLLLAWSVVYLRTQWQIHPLSLLRPFLVPGLTIVLMTGFTLAFRPFGWSAMPAAQIAIGLTAVGLAYAGLNWHARHKTSP
ncbi:oligosaccharide flippase family protein [Acidocella sp.]|uniref:oligosaccharide flippase family protein n=1 Tax=Acidocella sp. TaxID=50710 RepID=UPI003CFED101